MRKQQVMEIWERIREQLSGTHQNWYRRLLPQYGSWRKRQLEVRIRKEQKRVLYRLGMCVTVMFLSIAWAIFFGSEPETMTIAGLERILNEGGDLVLSYGNTSYEVNLEEFKEREVGKSNGKELLKEARDKISREMLHGNADWDHVSGKLYFPQQLDSGVYVYYETSDPTRISDQGLVDGIGAEEGIPVMIHVTMILGNEMDQYTVPCTVIPPQTEEDERQALQLRAETLEAALDRRNEDEGLSAEVMFRGVDVTAPGKENHGWKLASVAFLLSLIVVFGRYSEVEKQRENRRKRLTEELPLLMDQLILMMNAGLILSEALELISLTEDKGDGILREDLRFLCQRSEESKRPVVGLLAEYAVETGCSELVRFSSMLSDHVNRGSASLIQQLKMERNFAMETQWKQKETRYRRMEVQLSGPQFLLLGVILMVTTGPVLIGM